MGIFNGTWTKELFAAIAAAAIAYQTQTVDGVLDGTDIGIVIGAFLAGLGLVAIAPFEKYLKPIAATVVTTATFLATAVGDGISTDEAYSIVAILIGALGTYVFPNAGASTRK